MRRNRAANRTNHWLRTTGASRIGRLAVVALAWGLVATTPPVALGTGSGASSAAAQTRGLDLKDDVDLLEIDMFYQFSETDNDAEVTIDVEADEPVAHLRIIAPDNHTVATIRSKDHLGLAEIELESAEPSVEEVQAAYPEGTYWFWGRAVDGNRLYAEIDLTHEVIAAPDFFNFPPCDEEVDPMTAVTIAWNSVDGAEGGYELIIEQDETGANLRLTLGADMNTFTIPQGFLASGLEYEIEMKSVTGGGNKTSASCEFSTL